MNSSMSIKFDLRLKNMVRILLFILYLSANYFEKNG